MAYIEERTSLKGVKSYRALVRQKGHRTACATFKRKTDAVAWAKETEVNMQQGKFAKTAFSRKFTVNDMIERYLEKVKNDNPARLAEVSHILRWWKQEIGYLLLNDMSANLIAEKIEKLRQSTRKLKSGEIKKISPARVNRYIAALGHSCTIAHNEWEWLETNPVRKIKKFREPTGRVRFLDEDERNRLLAECRSSQSKFLYPVVVLALSTGMRQGEILNLTWNDIDLGRCLITLHKTKNKERRVVPLTGHAYDLLLQMRKIHRLDTNLLFPSPENSKKSWSCRGSWDAAVLRAKLNDFRFHDLRHSAASYLAMNGATLVELATVLGHKTMQMVKRYAHLSESHTHNVVASMNSQIFGGNHVN